MTRAEILGRRSSPRSPAAFSYFLVPRCVRDLPNCQAENNRRMTVASSSLHLRIPRVCRDLAAVVDCSERAALTAMQFSSTQLLFGSRKSLAERTMSVKLRRVGVWRALRELLPYTGNTSCPFHPKGRSCLMFSRRRFSNEHCISPCRPIRLSIGSQRAFCPFPKGDSSSWMRRPTLGRGTLRARGGYCRGRRRRPKSGFR